MIMKIGYAFFLLPFMLLGAGCAPTNQNGTAMNSNSVLKDQPLEVSPEPHPTPSPKPVEHSSSTSTSVKPTEALPVKSITWETFVDTSTFVTFEYPGGESVSGGAIMHAKDEPYSSYSDTLADYSIGGDSQFGESAPAEGPPGTNVTFWANPKGLSLKDWAYDHYSYTGLNKDDSYYAPQQNRKDITINGAPAMIYSFDGLYGGRTILIEHGTDVIQVTNEIEDPGDAITTHIAESVKWIK